MIPRLPWSVPPSWVWATMGEIAEVVGGGTPSTRDPRNFDGGAIPWITPADLSGYANKTISHGERSITEKGLTESAARVMPAGTVLFSSRAPIGYVAIAANSVATNQGFKSFVLREGILSDYVYYYLRRAKDLAVELASGTTFKEISGSNAARIPIPIAPQAEQQRIVDAIESYLPRLDDAVASLERARANLKRYRASVLKAAGEGRLVPTEADLARQEGREYEPASVLLERILSSRRATSSRAKRHVEPQGPDIAQLAELPAGWCWATVQQLTLANRPCAYGVLQPGPHEPTGIPLVRVGDISDGAIVTQALKRIAPSIAARYPRTRLQGGEVLISLVGAIGRTAVVPDTLAGANTARAVGVIPLSPHLEPSWIEAWFRNPEQIAQMTGLAHEVARKTLNLEDVRQATVALPPRAEQIRIVSALRMYESVAAKIADQIDANVERCAVLRASILRSAFSGRLVDQNPADEPAAAVIERTARAGRRRRRESAGGHVEADA